MEKMKNMKINENKIISAISEGLKHALNEISDETIKAAADKAGRLGYYKYLTKMNSYLESNWKVFKKFAFPQDSVYGLLAENKNNSYEKNEYLIVLGITNSNDGRNIEQIVFKISIELLHDVNESFIDNEDIENDIDLSNNKQFKYTCKLITESPLKYPIIKNYFDTFDFYYYDNGNITHRTVDKENTKMIYKGDIHTIRTDSRSWLTTFKGPYTIKKILLKVIPTFNKYTGFNLNYKTVMELV